MAGPSPTPPSRPTSAAPSHSRLGRLSLAVAFGASSGSPYAEAPFDARLVRPRPPPTPPTAARPTTRPSTARRERDTSHTAARPTRPASASVRRTNAPTNAVAMPVAASSGVMHELHRPRRHHTSSEEPTSGEPDIYSAAISSARPPAIWPALPSRVPPTTPSGMHNLNRHVASPPSHAAPAAAVAASSAAEPLSPASAEAMLGFGGGGSKRAKRRPVPSVPPAPVPALVDLYAPPEPLPVAVDASASSPRVASPVALSTSDLNPDSTSHAHDSLPPLVIDWSRELRLATEPDGLLRTDTDGTDALDDEAELDEESKYDDVEANEPESGATDAEGVASSEGTAASSSSRVIDALPLFMRQKLAREAELAAAAESTHHATSAEESKEDAFASPSASSEPPHDPFLVALDATGGASPPLRPSPRAARGTRPPRDEATVARLRTHARTARHASLAVSSNASRAAHQVEAFLVGQVALANEIARETNAARAYQALRLTVETGETTATTNAAATKQRGKSVGGADAASSSAAATAASSATPAPAVESKFVVRVYQTRPTRLVLRDVQLSQFGRELAQLLQRRAVVERRDAISRASSSARSDSRSGGGGGTSVLVEERDEARRVAVALEGVLEETKRMAAALAAQVRTLRAKAVRPVKWDTPTTTLTTKTTSARPTSASTSRPRTSGGPAVVTGAITAVAPSPYSIAPRAIPRPLSAR